MLFAPSNSLTAFGYSDLPTSGVYSIIEAMPGIRVMLDYCQRDKLRRMLNGYRLECLFTNIVVVKIDNSVLSKVEGVTLIISGI